jgi:hypothetical protein
MITKSDLLILQEGGVDLIYFVDSFLEKQISEEKDSQKYELLVQVYSEGWGSSIGNFVGRHAANLAKGFSQGYQSSNAANGPKQSPEQVAQKALEMLKNAGLLGNAELQQLTNYLKQQIENMNMGNRMAGKTSAPPEVKFGGAPAPAPAPAPSPAPGPITSSYNPELNFYGFTQILEGQTKEAPQGRRNAECARCGNKEKAKLYDINAGKAKCSKCGGYLNLLQSNS